MIDEIVSSIMAAPIGCTSDEENDTNICVIHIKSTSKSKFLSFSDKSWNKFLSCAPKWKTIDGCL